MTHTMKLGTETAILEWAGKSPNWPNETAGRLAYCVRVTEIEEREAEAFKGGMVGAALANLLVEAAQSVKNEEGT